MNILNVVGARPNLMKMAPITRAMEQHQDLNQQLLHTGQHYDTQMSQIFFDELEIPKPDTYLGVGSGSHASQTAQIMVAFEDVLLKQAPDLVLVVGDVNSTLACALTATKLQIPVAHVEAGLRSHDRRMPEEINRLVVDTLSSYLFTTSRCANENLKSEGVDSSRIYFVGNVMIDTLYRHREQARALQTSTHFGLDTGDYVLLTLHRPSNVDDPAVLDEILDALETIQKHTSIIFPVHPRTSQRIDDFGVRSRIESMPNLCLVEPQGYLSFLDLMMHAALVMTDSGGIQEETTALGVPCLTLRENTERPETIKWGTNHLVDSTAGDIVAAAEAVLNGPFKPGRIPELWDGKAATRIVDIILQQPGS